ncbi:calcium/sodium antiporter [Mangrovicoccus algicola]|uniref:Calcium/sodium antiporter n=1 Tax=Mangrovicoccus algicola TaxID=2771008 RepID=A0A8J7CJY6_9RHOB|nr:calcium/sodium antiporter [Mangrovicoccus algicola]MBE3638056.1 calcium/sodium antiporter [Mangrovicoccus algicola]
MDWVYTGLGLVILLLAGDALVKGAVNLALRLGIPALIVGLTIVAFGTSAPELLISIRAVLDGAPGIALGNVVGSNTANILLVLGIPALIAPILTSQCDTRKTYLGMLAASVLFIVICFLGPITWIHGLVLLAGLALLLWDQARDARAHRAQGEAAVDEAEDLEGADPAMPGWKVGVWLVLGLIGLPLGANLLVEGAVNIARDFGISETAIGLTLVAVGTSLPELATTVVAAMRRHAEVALGNVIGSNMFNLLGIMGVTGLIRPVPVEAQFLTTDLWVMLGASLLLIPFVLMGRNLTRLAGAGLLALYAGYLAIVLG